MDRDDGPPAGSPLRVSVVYSPRAGEVDEVVVELPPGATVADAIRASRLAERYATIESLPVGLWGAFCARDAALRDHDRVELYRPLQVDPKDARRRRQRAQRSAPGRSGEKA